MDFLERYFACILYAAAFTCIIGTVPDILAKFLTNVIGSFLSDEVILLICPILFGVAFSAIIKLFFRETYSSVFGSYIDLIFSYLLIVLFRYILSDMINIPDLALILSFISSILIAVGIDVVIGIDY